MVQVILPDGDRKGPLAARCATVAGAGVGAGAGVTVTVTVGGGGGVDAVDADGDVDVDIAGLSDIAWTEPADEEHPATVIAASATSHT